MVRLYSKWLCYLFGIKYKFYPIAKYVSKKGSHYQTHQDIFTRVS